MCAPEPVFSWGSTGPDRLARCTPGGRDVHARQLPYARFAGWNAKCLGSGQKDEPMKQQRYEKELRKLQVRLYLQRWVKEKGLRVVIVFEGRDGAGKGGTIRAITERVSPRVFRVVALPAPSDREKSRCTSSATCALSRGRRNRDL